MLSAFSSQSTVAADLLESIKSTAISKWDFGIYRIGIVTKDWSENYSEYPGISVAREKTGSNAISFTIFGATSLSKIRDRRTLQDACNNIGYHFLRMMFGNYGDITERNADGVNIYYLAWGAYFAVDSDTREEVEELGKTISIGSTVTVLTSNPLLEKCVFDTNAKYSK
jgi:uncharacterized protein YqkB